VSKAWKSADGSIQLINGDCMELLADVSPETIRAVLTDHPYGSTDCHWDKVVDLAAWRKAIDRVTPPNAIVASFAAQPFATDLINSTARAFRYELVWHKAKAVGFLNANRQPLRGHELIMVFCRQPGKSTYNPQKTPGKPYRVTAKPKTAIYRDRKFILSQKHGDRHPTSFLAHNSIGGKRCHPTQKPLPMCEWMVRSYLNACKREDQLELTYDQASIIGLTRPQRQSRCAMSQPKKLTSTGGPTWHRALAAR
jgi:hypothetical protein